MLAQKAKQQEGQLKMSTTTNLTGYHNLGQFQILLEKTTSNQDLSVYDRIVILAIARYSIGYCRATTNVPEGKGYNRNSKAWADTLGISKTSFLRSIKKLNAMKLIKIHRGSQYMTNGGSFPDYYSLVFYPELQIKNHIYFNLDGVNNSSTPDTSKYFVDENGAIAATYTNGKPSLEWKRYCSRVDNIVTTHPSLEDLTNHLEKLNDT